ncbi:MAG: hypothetical protein DRR19_00600 [Candidatus Parabeggiatoa sp. nov. 1]|nr:MAG: hypothetical protein DRR19_00600 [Gammaproteobacteria bacterium]
MKIDAINQNTNQVEFQEIVPPKGNGSNGSVISLVEADKPKTLGAELTQASLQPSKMVRKPNTYYEVLGVNQNATDTEIAQAIPAKMSEMTEAVQVLSDHEKRKAYDSGVKSAGQPQINPQGPNVSPYQPFVAPTTGLTNDNVFELARRDTRLVAHLVDVLIFLSLPFLAILIMPFFVDTSVLADGGKGSEEAMLTMVWPLGFVVLGWIALTAINWTLLYQNGQTIGKRLLDIKIVRTDGSRAGLLRIVGLRYFVIQIIAGIGPEWWKSAVVLIDPLFIFQKSRRCLHDLIADTTVIEAIPGGSAHRSPGAILTAIIMLMLLPIAAIIGVIVVIASMGISPSDLGKYSHTDYVNHYQTVQAVNFIEALKTPTEQYFSFTEKFPPSVADIKGKTSSKYVEKIVSNPEQLYFQATLSGKEHSPIGEQTIRLTYNPATGHWKCSSGHPNGVDNKYLPQHCRNEAQ